MIKKIIPILLSATILAGCSGKSDLKKEESSVPETTGITETEANSPEENFKAGEYVSTGNTELKITKIEVYNSEYPGEKEVNDYSPGYSLLINLWCEDEPRNSSFSYVVSSDTEHKKDYSLSEYEHKEEMFFYTPSAEGQYFYDLVLPDDIAPGNYELRFVCGDSEEGYFTFTVK